MRDQFFVSAIGAVVEIDMSRLGMPAREVVRTTWVDSVLPGEREPDAVVSVCHDLADDTTMLQRLASDVERAAEEASQGRLWMLDCLAFADGDGHVVAILAGAETRESLAAALATRFKRISDRAIGIDRRGGVRAFRAPLRAGVADGAASASASAPASASASASASDGDRVGSQILSLSRIVLVDLRDLEPAGAEGVEKVAMIEALPSIVSQSPHIDALRGALGWVETILDATGGCVRISSHDADAAVAAVAALFAEVASTAPSLPPSRPKAAVKRWRSDTHGFCFRGPALDELVLSDGRTILLHRGGREAEVTVLDPISSHLWAAASGVPQSELFSALEPLAGQGSVQLADLAGKAIEDLKKRGHIRHEPSWRVSDGAAWTSSEMRTIVMDLDGRTARPLALEGTARVIWALLVHRLSVAQEQLLFECGEVFGIDPELISGDVIALLFSLCDEGVLDVV